MFTAYFERLCDSGVRLRPEVPASEVRSTQRRPGPQSGGGFSLSHFCFEN